MLIITGFKLDPIKRVCECILNIGQLTWSLQGWQKYIFHSL